MTNYKEEMLKGICILLEQTKGAKTYEELHEIAINFHKLYTHVANEKNNRHQKHIYAFKYYANAMTKKSKSRDLEQVKQKSIKSYYKKKESYRNCIDEITEMRAKNLKWKFIQAELKRRYGFKKMPKPENMGRWYSKQIKEKLS